MGIDIIRTIKIFILRWNEHLNRIDGEIVKKPYMKCLRWKEIKKDKMCWIDTLFNHTRILAAKNWTIT